jgi:HK97 family phage prohead protease
MRKTAARRVQLVMPRTWETKSVAAAPRTRVQDLNHEVSRSYPVTQFKSIDDSRGEFEGYLAVFGNEDYNGDIIEKGAFTKTLREAYEIKDRRKATFLFPLLWMHDVDDPCGGFFDMKEDTKGLYVKGMCDMDTERGRRAFSGMQKGYMAQMSIGYDTIKATRDQKGIRHLLETRLWEGSVVTTGYAANGEANVTQTKTVGMIEAKGACGKSDWPLADRDIEWDAEAAHQHVVAWATKADGTLDESKMKSVHFWYDDSAPGDVASYKLSFCDVTDGTVKAIPKGIFACTGSHGIQAVKDVIAGDMMTIKSKISSYYRRMRTEFVDDTLAPMWDQKAVFFRTALERKQWGGLQTLTRSISNIDDLGSMIETYLEMLGDVCGVALDDEDDDLPEGMPAPVMTPVQPAVQVILDGVPGFRAALTALGTTWAAFDQASDLVVALMGMQSSANEYDGDYYYMMSADPSTERKIGMQFSASNRKTLGDACDAMETHSSKMRDMLAQADADKAAKSIPGGEETKDDNFLDTLKPGNDPAGPSTGGDVTTSDETKVVDGSEPDGSRSTLEEWVSRKHLEASLGGLLSSNSGESGATS